jgi:hypothetical protein
MENLTDKSSEVIKAALTKAEEQSNAQGMPPFLFPLYPHTDVADI